MKSRKKLIVLIIAIIIAVSSVFIYKFTIEPKLYDKYLNTGIKYLMDGEYEEAILAFDKAIKIEPKTTEARVYQAKAYIGNEEFDNAVEVLEEAQNIDKTNKDLLKEILEILNEIDSDIAYEFLDRFINEVGKENLSEDIQTIVDLSNESPSEPIVDPKPGKYTDSISVKLKSDKMKVGHTYYYTLDGSIPNKNSNKYVGNIEISKTTTIKLIGYNKKDESTDEVTLEYIIDKKVLKDLKSNIKEAEKLIKDTSTGTEVGNISKDDKNKLKYIVDNAKDLINKENKSYEDISNMKDKLVDGIAQFKKDIIKPTDKSKLKTAINTAQELYDNSSEGTKDGQYKSGSRQQLLNTINNSKKIYNDKLSKQKDIDNQVDILMASINKFKNSENKAFTKETALQYITDYFYEKPCYNKKMTDEYGNTWYETREYGIWDKFEINGKEYYQALIIIGVESDTYSRGDQRPVYIGSDKIVYNCARGIYDNVVGEPVRR